MSTDRLSEIISQITPERLREVILGLCAGQPQGNRSGVSLESIVGALVAEADLGEGSARFGGYQRLKQAIQDGVAHISGMQYVRSRD